MGPGLDWAPRPADAHDAQWISDKDWHPTEMMLMQGWVWGGPADAHDAWLAPYENDADDAHAAQCPIHADDADDARWVRV